MWQNFLRYHCFCNAKISKHVYFGCFVDFRHKAPQPHRCGALCISSLFPQSLLSPTSCFSLLSRISKSTSFFPAKSLVKFSLSFSALRARTLQRFPLFCFHNLHSTAQKSPRKPQFLACLLSSQNQPFFFPFSTQTPHFHELCSYYPHKLLTYCLLFSILWRLWKQKVQNCRVCACAHAREPHFSPSFYCDFQPSIPSPLSLPFESKKNHSFPLKIIQVFPRKLFDYTKSSLSSTRNFVPIEQKYSPIKQDIFSHKHKKRRR